MIKKTISVFVLSIILLSNVIAFVHYDECDMPCCKDESTQCCMMTDMDECSSSMITCEKATFVPMVSAPLNKVEQQINVTVDAHVVARINVSNHATYLNNILSYLIPDPPLIFLTPLLI